MSLEYEMGYSFAEWGDRHELHGVRGPVDLKKFQRIPTSDYIRLLIVTTKPSVKKYWDGFNTYWAKKGVTAFIEYPFVEETNS